MDYFDIAKGVGEDLVDLQRYDGCESTFRLTITRIDQQPQLCFSAL